MNRDRPGSAGQDQRSLRVLVADDQALVRAGLQAILEEQPGIRVVGEAADGRDAIDLVRRRHPDVVLMDIQMPDINGLEAARRILAEPTTTTRWPFWLTTFDLNEYVYDALRAGASGFLLKDAPRADLIAAVRVVAAGDALLAPTVTKRLIEAFAARARADHVPGPSRLAALTPRERDILLLVAAGRVQHGDRRAPLAVSQATVKTHVAHLLAKLGLRDRVQAVILAYETGAVTPGRPD